MKLLTIAYLLLLAYIIFKLCRSILERRNKCCYLLHYECYKGLDDRKLDSATCGKIALRNKNLGPEEHIFLQNTLVSCGIGEETYVTRNMLEEREASPTIQDAYLEMDEVLFDTLDNLFAKTQISPSEIDILVVNVSMVSFAPSLTSRVINRYKMREDIKSYNLCGLGCSASVIAIGLVQRLFKSHNNALAVVASTESTAPNWYCGKNRSMMLTNCLFRVGGVSMLLTNNRGLQHKAIMKLDCAVRTHVGSDDDSYGCCMQMEDAEGYQGVLLTKYLKTAAIKALTQNLKVLLPKVLPIKELLRYAIVNYLMKKTKDTNTRTSGSGLNLKTGIDHFCLHPGGKAVIDGVGKSLGLNDYEIEPARMTLHRFGNTSSAGIWYVLSYMEAKKRLKKGDKILMISLGAGFESNNCVWKIMREMDDGNVWEDFIDSYPVMTHNPNPFKKMYETLYN